MAIIVSQHILKELNAGLLGKYQPSQPDLHKSSRTDWSRYTAKTRFAWLQRPRLHTEIFSQVWLDEEIAKRGGKLVGDKAQKEDSVIGRALSVAAELVHAG